MGIPLHKGFVFGDGFFHRSALVRFGSGTFLAGVLCELAQDIQ